MTLIEIIEKGGWPALWKHLISGGIFTTDSAGNPAVLFVPANKPDRTEIDVNVDTYTYYGTAPYGSNKTSDAVWVIERQNAAKTEFLTSAPNQDWADRTTIDYNNGTA